MVIHWTRFWQRIVDKELGIILTISISGLSRIHPSTRRPSFSTKRVDPRKYENWTSIGSHDSFQHFKYGIEISMFNDISCDGKGNEEECVANSKVVSILAKKFGVGQWSFIGPGSEKKWYSMEEKSTRNLGSHRGQDAVGIRRKRMSYFPCNDSIVQR